MKARTCQLTLGLLTTLSLLPAVAQDGLRDPTQAPASTRPAAPAASGTDPTSGQPQHIMVMNGRPYLIVAGRRLGVGDAWGEARITRIGDGAVWVKEGGVTRRLSLYAGVEIKRPPAVPPARPAGPKNNKEQP